MPLQPMRLLRAIVEHAVSSFSSSTVPAVSAATDVVLTIGATAPVASLNQRQTVYAAWMPFAGLGLFGIVLVGTPRGRKRRKAAMLLMTLFVMGALTLLAGCGGSHKVTDPGTTKGTFPITVTGTSGNVSHNASFNLTVN